MEQYKKEFIEFMIDCNVLKFGDFVTKSGRKTPFFVNTGFYRTGAQLKRLGEYYAQAIHDQFGLDFDVLFGPAYKGIPLSVAATIAISEKYDTDIRYCSNRKEVKDHGDKGILLGSPIQDGDKIVIIEDVTTAGTSIQETLCRKEEDSCVHYMMEGNGYIEKNNQKEDWFAEFFLPDHIRLRCVIFCIVQ